MSVLVVKDGGFCFFLPINTELISARQCICLESAVIPAPELTTGPSRSQMKLPENDTETTGDGAGLLRLAAGIQECARENLKNLNFVT